MKAEMTSMSLVRVLGAMLLLSAGCGSSSPPGGTGAKGGSSGGATSGGAGTTGSGGATGSAGSTGVAGTTGTGGMVTGAAGTAAGTAGSTGGGSGAGGLTGTGGAGGLTVGTSQCSDGKDNDGDGKVDYDDPECVGPLDNDESSFATGIPGDNKDACKQDCFFDGNSGAGDDHCDWQLKCDPTSVENKCPYDQQYAMSHQAECSVSASQSQACVDFCRRLVPNGCDCFGCCVVPGASTPIRLAPTCTAADFGNPAKCPVCTQVTQCSNPCERCEICIGKTTVPADCAPDTDGGTDGPPPNDCGSDFVACGPGTQIPANGCPQGYGCITGCCIPLN